MTISHQTKTNFKNNPTLISLFTCGMGLDLGFEKAGFKTQYANDIKKYACNTIRRNRPNIPCDEGDINNIKTKDILNKAHLKKSDVDVIIGGPPCQSFSQAGKRRGLNDPRGLALLEFIRIVKDIKPKIFVFENVPGLKSAPKKHISFYDRASSKKLLSKDQQYGSLFQDILHEFNGISNRYKIHYKILNSADYGVPQKRKRLILIGTRITKPEFIFNEIEKYANFVDPNKINNSNKQPWRTLKDALDGMKDDIECTNFPKWGKYLKYIPAGGCWIDLPTRLKKQAMKGAADTDDPKKKGKQGGRRGFYRKLSWNKPSPTLTTSPTQLGNCLCHPDELRPLSVREYARIQGFPDNWVFEGSTAQKYRMIGEAVPITLAYYIGCAVKKYLNLNKNQ